MLILNIPYKGILHFNYSRFANRKALLFLDFAFLKVETSNFYGMGSLAYILFL